MKRVLCESCGSPNAWDFGDIVKCPCCGDGYEPLEELPYVIFNEKELVNFFCDLNSHRYSLVNLSGEVVLFAPPPNLRGIMHNQVKDEPAFKSWIDESQIGEVENPKHITHSGLATHIYNQSQLYRERVKYLKSFSYPFFLWKENNERIKNPFLKVAEVGGSSTHSTGIFAFSTTMNAEKK